MPVRTRGFLAAGARMTSNNPQHGIPVVPTSHSIPTSSSGIPAIVTSIKKPASLFSSLSSVNGENISSTSPTPETPERKRRKIAAVVVTPSPSPATPTSSSVSTSSSEKKKKKTNQKAVVVKKQCLPPDDWQNTYSMVKELRSDRTAPCDHSGCEALPDKTSESPEQFRFQVLLSLMLSSQTKDAVVGAAVRAMQKDNVASVTALANQKLSPEALNSYIQKCSFHNNKTKYILETVRILQDSYGGDIPRTATELMALPGVGPKMAYICESVAWGTQSGIGVDTHMHRLFNQLDFVDHTKTPEQTRIQLESWLPRELWGEVNLLWVGFGQEVQQERAKILLKALDCTRPMEALMLLKRCGVDYKRVLECDDIARVEAIFDTNKE